MTDQPHTFTIGGDMAVNRMGFGAMRITGAGVWGRPRDNAEAVRVLRRVVERGVNFIDTADSYGPHVSEELIAEALHPYPPGVVIATKGGYERPGPNQWRANGRPEHLRTALEGSLKRLRLERIDLYQLHTPDPRVPFEESVGALVDMQQAGKIRHIGLSNVSVRELEIAQNIAPIVSVQNQYNITDRSSEDVLNRTNDLGMAFIPWYPLAAAPQRLEHALRDVTTALGATTVQVALAWLLHHAPNMVVIPGTSSVAHAEENVAAAGLKLSEAQMRQLGA
jgi:aryl-alcohol dehydrogenase-like predicted oxidoreductase